MAEEESTREVELSLEDIEALQEALGVNAMRAENAQLRALLSDLLTYQNKIDRRLQRLEGEPTVTEDLEAHVGPGGSLSWERRKPPVPQNIEQFLKVRQKLPEEEGILNG